MKHSTKLTRAQRTFVENNGLNTREWEYVQEPSPNTIEVVNKATGEVRVIEKLTRKIKKG